MASTSLRVSNVSLPPESIIFGKSQSMRAVKDRIAKIAEANVPVLIEGPTGTGKDVIARLIHTLSLLASGPYVKVNCPAIPGSLLESELFGYEKGAFTGAYDSKPGRVELADRGTLFLDEISELDAGLQPKLLQVLQDGQFCRIGSQEDKSVEVRLICATNRRLEGEVEAGRFRQDLFYRINVVNIRVPALRERIEDLEELAAYFIAMYNEKYNCRTRMVSPAAMAAMQAHAWPGNIRELENLMRRYVILGNEEIVTAELTPAATFNDRFEPSFAMDRPMSLKKLTKLATQELEKKIITRVLQHNHWNRKKTAHSLGISYRALLYKLAEMNVSNGGTRANLADVSEQAD